jgi:hypothetical protein
MAADMTVRLPDEARAALEEAALADDVTPGRLAAEMVCAALGAADSLPPRRVRPLELVNAELVRACEGGATCAEAAEATGAGYQTTYKRLERARRGGLLRKRAHSGSRPALFAPTPLGRRVAGG